jgi:hypothetical protein
MKTPAMIPLDADDRSVAAADRRISQRLRTQKGGQIVSVMGNVKCIVRNLSDTGANIEIHSPVPTTFDLVFDDGQLSRSCRVVWRKATTVGVEFQK